MSTSMTDLTDIRIYCISASKLDLRTLEVATKVFDRKSQVIDRKLEDLTSLLDDLHEFQPDVIVVSLFNLVGVQKLITEMREHLEEKVPYFVAVSDDHAQDEAIKNIGELEIDTLLFTPFTNEQMRINLAAGYRYHQQYLKLQTQFAQASATAMAAMETASEIGFIMKLVDSLKYATDFEAVADQVFSVCSSLGLKASIMMSDEGVNHYFPKGQVTDSIQHVLSNAQVSSARVIEHKRLLLVRMDLLIIMVTNAPWQHDSKYGRIKDFLCQMGPVVEARIRTVMVNNLIEQQHDELMNVMNLMRRLSVDTQTNTRHIMQKLSNDLEVAALTLDLSEDHEKYLLQLSTDAYESLETLYVTNDALESHFHSIIDSLSKVRELATQYTNMDSNGNDGANDIELF